MSFVHRHTVSFKHAFAGIFYLINTQPNFRIHLLMAILAILAGFYFNITQIQWIIILFTICLVLITEAVNTSIESMIDLLTDQYHTSAKIAKDVSAGMVLITAISSVIIGLTIFIPYL
jgi:diacylglycerol kinase